MFRSLPFLAALFTAPPVESPVPRITPGTLRVVTWNIGANSVVPGVSGAPGDASRPAGFARVMRALDADVICLQELTIGAERAAALFDRVHPLPGGQRWHAVSQLGNTLVSRYPLSERRGVTMRQGFSQRGHVIARVAVPGASERDAPTVACMHLQAKDGAANVAFRERQAEAIVRDLRRVHGPVIALGDLNAIDRPASYLRTLQLGHGEGSPSPLGATGPFPLAAAIASHNGVGSDSYTWRDDRSGFAPGTLDYILFSERSFVPRASFVLNTMTLSEAALAESALHRGDALRESTRGVFDHLPVVVDLAPANTH